MRSAIERRVAACIAVVGGAVRDHAHGRRANRPCAGLLVGLLAGALAVAPLEAQRTLPARDATWSAQLLRMADARRLDTLLVDSVLATGVPALRRQAALAIGQVHGRARAARLRVLLADRDTAVAAQAAYALGLMPAEESVADLGAALGAAPTVAVEAAWALGEIGEPSRAAVTRALEAPPKPAAVRAAVLLAAAKLRPVPHTLVVQFLAVPEAEVRWAAAYAIARPRVAAAVRALFPLVRDRDAGVRAQVALALAKRVTGDSLG
ncbi:MAG: HEAT repeat domain-containing protein, partial [Gemmatimonadetes bacterium]|nr:HEAT repeat domain-containing protein [Gemmatimonadota bacterium]